MKTQWFVGFFLCIATITSAAEPGPFELHAVAAVASEHTKEYSEPTRGEKPEKILLDTDVLLDQTSVQSAAIGFEKDGAPTIQIKLTEEGRKALGDISTKYFGKRIGMVLDGQLQCSPVIKEPMFGGSFQITGNFTETQAWQIIQKINQSVSR